MDPLLKRNLVWASALVLTVSSIAWATAIATIYAPPKTAGDAAYVCAISDAARVSAYCIKMAETKTGG